MFVKNHFENALEFSASPVQTARTGQLSDDGLRTETTSQPMILGGATASTGGPLPAFAHQSMCGRQAESQVKVLDHLRRRPLPQIIQRADHGHS